MRLSRQVLSAWAVSGSLVAFAAAPLGTGFTYQGRLKQSGAPVNDIVDLQFQLLADDAGAEPVAGAEIQRDAVEVINGLFAVDLDFGAAAFYGEARWLRVSVRAPHDPSDTAEFTPLTPNAPISPAPYALQTRGIFVSETGEVGIGGGPFVDDANLQLGIDPVANTVFGGTNLQIGDDFAAQLVLGNGGTEFMQFAMIDSLSRINVIGGIGLDLRTGPTSTTVQSRLFLSSTGNVGIGTANPTTKLEIPPATTGTTLSIPNTFTVGRQQQVGIDRPFVGIGRSTPFNGNDAFAIEVPITEGNPWGGMWMTTSPVPGLPFYGYASSQFGAWTYLSGFDGTWRLFVGNGDWIQVTREGRTGIGSAFSAPNNPLTVFGNADVQGNLGLGIINPTNRLSVGGTANITGSLGIGTSTPGTSLHVFRGASGVTFPSTRSAILEDDASHFLELLAPDNVQTGILFGKPTGGSASAGIVFNNPGVENGLQFRTGTNDTRMVINDAGLVGIGTTSPQRQLHLSGGSDINTGGVGGALMIGSPTATNLILDENEIQPMSNGAVTNLGLNTLGGSVGIGTLSPQSLLHIFKADAGFSSNPANTLLTLESDAVHYMRFMVPDATETGILFGNPTNGGAAAGVIFDGSVPNGLQFRTGTNDTHMVIDSAGRLGLGTTAPATKMEIVANGAALRLTSANDSLPRLELKTGTSTFPAAGGIRFIDMNDEIEWSIHMDTGADLSIGVGTRDIINISPGFPDRVNIGNDSILDVQASNPDFDGVISLTRQLPGRLVRFSDADNANPAIISEIGNITYSGTTVSYNAFTGSHYGWSSGSFEEGTLMSMTGDNRRVRQDVRGEPIYGIAPTAVPNDPAVLGAYANPLGIDDRTDTHLVSSVGNGDLCLVDRGGGDIEPGDYLISSEVAGCAMKDDPAKFSIGHVVAKASERIRWSDVLADEHGVKRVKASVLFGSFVRDSRGQFAASEIQGLRAENADLRERLERLERLILQKSASANP